MHKILSLIPSEVKIGKHVQARNPICCSEVESMDDDKDSDQNIRPLALLDTHSWAFIRGFCHKYHNLLYMAQLICFQR